MDMLNDKIEVMTNKMEDNQTVENPSEETSIHVKDVLDAYRSSIYKIPIEEDSVIKEKLREIKGNKTISSDERAELRNDIIEAHLRYVNWLADKMWKMLLGANGDVPVEDLIQAGNVGLIKAIDKYDVAYVETDIPFIAYAKKYVENAIKDEIEKNWKNYLLDIDDENIRNSLFSTDDIEQNLIDVERTNEIHSAIQVLDESEKKALMLFYGISDSGEVERMPIHKISKELCMSTMDTELIIDMAEQKLKKELGK